MYNGNEQLRGPNEKIFMSPKLMKEYIKCKEDILYFAQHYFHIVDQKKGKHLIQLREYQKRILKAFDSTPDNKNHIAMLSSRQIGKCVFGSTKINVRNKKTGEIKEISMIDFYELTQRTIE